jgi:hypothetical protein
MTARISAPSLGAVAPYLVLGSLVLSPLPQTGATTPSIAETSFVRAERVFSPTDPARFAAGYDLALDRPDLMPLVIVQAAPSFDADFYEPFIISEGWREEASLEGPFLVEEDQSPIVTFDDFDRATIGLYE